MSQPYALKVHYHANGTGRDTYIQLDNGGNFIMHHPDKHPIRGTMGFGEPILG